MDSPLEAIEAQSDKVSKTGASGFEFNTKAVLVNFSGTAKTHFLFDLRSPCPTNMGFMFCEEFIQLQSLMQVLSVPSVLVALIPVSDFPGPALFCRKT